MAEKRVKERNRDRKIKKNCGIRIGFGKLRNEMKSQAIERQKNDKIATINRVTSQINIISDKIIATALTLQLVVSVVPCVLLYFLHVTIKNAFLNCLIQFLYK